jgi:aminopeptidase N
MKKFVFLLSLCLLNLFSFSQQSVNQQSKMIDEILKHLNNEENFDAIKHLDYYLSLYPQSPDAYYNRGITKFEMNDVPGARADFSKAKELGFHYDINFLNLYSSKSLLVKALTLNYLDFDSLREENGFKQVFTLKDSLRGALRPERTCFDVYYYNLTVRILPEIKSIEGSNQIYFKTTHQTDKIQIDLTGNYEIKSIKWKDKELKYSRIYDAIFIEFGETLPAGENEIVTIKYGGIPRVAPSPPWNGGFVWKTENSNWWVGVACEHLGASSWWPCKDHLTEKPDSMSINIQVPAGYRAIANGNLRSTNPINTNYTNFEWFVGYPINSYGVTLYMGKFIDFNEEFTDSAGAYMIDYYVLPRHLKKAKKYYSQTKDIVRVYEKLFGEYPYKNDGMAMVEAPYSGMENQSAIAIGDEYGRKKHKEYENMDYDYLLVHETAHEWWGNTVTMADMADAWISEGFATYSEQLFMEEKYGYAEYVSGCAADMRMIFNIWPLVGIKDVNDNTFLGGDIYNKGAAMLNNPRCIINNDSLFFALIKDFYTQNKFKTLTSTDVVNFVNAYTKSDYTDFFNKFLYSADPPVLQYDFVLQNNTLYFEYKWINVGPKFRMPFSIAINENDNIRIEAGTDKQIIKIENVKSFYLPNENRYKKEQIRKNAFTYYWTSWKPFNPFH